MSAKNCVTMNEANAECENYGLYYPRDSHCDELDACVVGGMDIQIDCLTELRPLLDEFRKWVHKCGPTGSIYEPSPRLFRSNGAKNACETIEHFFVFMFLHKHDLVDKYAMVSGYLQGKIISPSPQPQSSSDEVIAEEEPTLLVALMETEAATVADGIPSTADKRITPSEKVPSVADLPQVIEKKISANPEQEDANADEDAIFCSDSSDEEDILVAPSSSKEAVVEEAVVEEAVVEEVVVEEVEKVRAKKKAKKAAKKKAKKEKKEKKAKKAKKEKKAKKAKKEKKAKKAKKEKKAKKVKKEKKAKKNKGKKTDNIVDDVLPEPVESKVVEEEAKESNVVEASKVVEAEEESKVSACSGDEPFTIEMLCSMINEKDGSWLESVTKEELIQKLNPDCLTVKLPAKKKGGRTRWALPNKIRQAILAKLMDVEYEIIEKKKYTAPNLNKRILKALQQ